MRLRVRHTKLGKVRFVGHRDLARVWERAIRKVALPIAYTEGFNPRPKLHFGLALSVGHESLAEYIDIDLREPVDAIGLADRLSAALPVGVDVAAIAVVERSQLALQAAVSASTWWFDVPVAPGLADTVARLLAADSLPIEVERKGAASLLDARPQIESLALDSHGPMVAPTVDPCAARTTRITAVLGRAERSLRPSELLGLLGDGAEVARVTRVEQWIDVDGSRRAVLPVADHTSPDTPVVVPVAS